MAKGAATRRTLDDALTHNCFDWMRLAFACLVIVGHSLAFTHGMWDDPVLCLTGGRLSIAGAAVDGFFVVSGFLISHSWATSQPLAFVLKRTRRIWPGYVVAGLFSFASVRQWPDWSVLVLRTPHELNVPMWTIPPEASCYALTPLLVIAPAWSLSVLVAGFTALNLVFPDPHQPDGGAMRLAAYFAMGAFLYRWRAHVPVTRRLIAIAGLCAVLTLWLAPTTVAVPVLAYVFLAVACWFNARARSDYSYGMYLYGYPVQSFLCHYITGPLAFPLASLAATAPFAFLSWHLVENRFLRRAAALPGEFDPGDALAANQPVAV